MAPSGKERAASPAPSVATTSAPVAVAIDSGGKAPAPEVSKPDPFAGSRFKFKAFCTQVRLGIWADNLRPVEKRLLRYTDQQALWAASFLRGDAYMRMEPYVSHRLEVGHINSCNAEVKKVMLTVDSFLGVLAQSYGDLDEARTSELQLMELKQQASVPEYLTRFMQYASRVAWDERAKMAQFYKGLKANIKDAMAIQGFPPNWEGLIQQATRLDDNFRRRSQEGRGTAPKWKPRSAARPSGDTQRHPDEMDWVAGSATKQYRKTRKMPTNPKKKGNGDCYNCGKPGHFARECKSGKQAKAARPGKVREPRKRANAADHGKMSWTACYEDDCLVHLSEKDGADYFPKGKGPDSEEDRMCFNMVYGDPPDPTEPEDEETPPDDWFVEEIGTAPPPEEQEEEPEELLPPFEENQPSPEYEACADGRHQEWARENIMLKERTQASLQRNRDMMADLEERRNESRSLRDQFDSITEHVDVLTDFLEKLKTKTHLNGCAMCGWEPGSRRDSETQTDYPGPLGAEDAYYFLEERPPAFSIYHGDGGYTTPEGVHITRNLRQKFLDLRSEYRDQHRARSTPIPLRDLPKVPGPPAPRLPPAETPKPLSIPSRSRKSTGTGQRSQKDKGGRNFDEVVERASRAQKGKQKSGGWFS